MTEISDIEVTIVEPLDAAMALIDESLGGLTSRQLVSASEMADLLLDVRMLLSGSEL